MTVQDWHTHAEQVATPARTISEPSTTEHTSRPTSGRQNDLAADLAALTRVLLGVGAPVTHTPRVAAADIAPALVPEPVVELEPAPLFVAPALVEVPSLVEAAAPPVAPRPRVNADQLIDHLGFLDV